MRRFGFVVILMLTGCASFRNSPPMRWVNDRFGPVSASDGTYQVAQERYLAAHPGISEPVRKAILEGRIVRGMTTDDVRSVLGNPSTIDAHETIDKQVSTWNYCLGDTIRSVDFEGNSVIEMESRSGVTGTWACKEASREMWIGRRSRDSGK